MCPLKAYTVSRSWSFKSHLECDLNDKSLLMYNNLTCLTTYKFNNAILITLASVFFTSISDNILISVQVLVCVVQMTTI